MTLHSSCLHKIKIILLEQGLYTNTSLIFIVQFQLRLNYKLLPFNFSQNLIQFSSIQSIDFSPIILTFIQFSHSIQSFKWVVIKCPKNNVVLLF